MESKAAVKDHGVEKIIQVASTLAIEDMSVGSDIVQNLVAVSRGEKTIDDCIKELDERYSGGENHG